MTKKNQPKARKLSLNKKTVKDLTSPKGRNVKGGVADRKASIEKSGCACPK